MKRNKERYNEEAALNHRMINGPKQVEKNKINYGRLEEKEMTQEKMKMVKKRKKKKKRKEKELKNVSIVALCQLHYEKAPFHRGIGNCYQFVNHI